MICSLLDKIANQFLIDSMGATFEPIVACLDFVFPLVGILDSDVADALKASTVAPHVTLSWCITWFSHDVHDPVVNHH